MDSDKFLEMIRDDVVPAIKTKRPDVKYVQWDNATPHTAENLKEIDAVLAANGLERVTQCPNSPETNALDLGFNKSLDSRLPRVRSFNLDDFELQILQCFASYPEEKLHALFDRGVRNVELGEYRHVFCRAAAIIPCASPLASRVGATAASTVP